MLRHFTRKAVIALTAAILASVQPAYAQTNGPAAMSAADYQAKLAQYLQARQAYDAEADAYWNAVIEKRHVRNAKRRDHLPIQLADYVLSQPPVYAGPPRPINAQAPPPELEARHREAPRAQCQAPRPSADPARRLCAQPAAGLCGAAAPDQSRSPRPRAERTAANPAGRRFSQSRRRTIRLRAAAPAPRARLQPRLCQGRGRRRPDARSDRRRLRLRNRRQRHLRHAGGRVGHQAARDLARHRLQ